MHKHCKDCVSHWSGGKVGTKYTDWCAKYSNVATKIVGHCKLHNGKKTND